MKFSLETKRAGLMAPLFALRGTEDLGIGDTAAVVEFAQWAANQGFGLIQILPINETGSDHSPYNILSSVALEPSTLALRPDWLPDLRPADHEKILADADLAPLLADTVDYPAVKALKFRLLESAFANFRGRSKASQIRQQEFADWRSAHADWLEAYAFFRALVHLNGGIEVFEQWPEAQRSAPSAANWRSGLSAQKEKHLARWIEFFAYVQWIAFSQWERVRQECEALGVAIMGDIPVGVSRYSADLWSEPQWFDSSRSCGAPPEHVFKTDPFTAQWGQNWGFPLYDWAAMEKDNYSWWRRRLRVQGRLFHLLRVDHALGFFRIYSFPWRPERNGEFTGLTEEEARAKTGGQLPGFVDYDDTTEEHCAWNRERGMKIFRMMLEETGPYRIIAEDLGEVAPYVRPALTELEIPGFKIPQWEPGPDGRLLPGAEYPRLALTTYATHDHAPVRMNWEIWELAAGQGDEDAIHAMWQLLDFGGVQDTGLPKPFSPEIHRTILRGLFASNAWLAVHMVPDLFGTTERFNVPGSASAANWTTRLTAPISEWTTLHEELLTEVRKLLAETDRLHQKS